MIVGETRAARFTRLMVWRRRFAYLPVRLCDGCWLWWDWYFERRHTADPFGGRWHGTYRRQRVWRVPMPGDPEWRGPRDIRSLRLPGED